MDEKADIYADYVRTHWLRVKDGDTVYIDNFENGKFPQANPKISGPYTVENAEQRILKTGWKVKWRGKGEGHYRTFMYYPDNLLRKV